jgi:hypothetical protein
MSLPQVKVCKVCRETKSVEAFAPNQYGKDNRVVRRPICKECYAKKIKVSAISKKDFILKTPRPKIGESFTCPICMKSFIRQHINDVVLDHSHIVEVFADGFAAVVIQV